MGNCFSKGRSPAGGQSLSAGAGGGTGPSGHTQQATPGPPSSAGTASTQQAVPSSSSGAGSAVKTSSQPNQSSSPQASIDDLVKRLQADPKDVTKFKDILAFIDQAIEQHQKPSRFEIDVPESISENLDDAEKTLKGINDVCQDKDGISSAGLELQQILSDAFGGLGNLHWITAAFSVVAFVLKRIDSTKQNKESCLDILMKIQKLGHHLVDLFELIPNENLKFWQTGAVIVEAAIFCVNELDASYFKRFTFVNVRMGDLSKFKEQIPHLYQELTLIVAKENLIMGKETVGRMALPVQSYKPEDANIVGREEIISEVLAAMQLVPQMYQAILLHGIGGIGKTTIGDKVAKECNSQLTRSIAKAEVGDNPSIEKICSCQELIIKRLKGSKRDIRDPSEGRLFLQDHFKQLNSPILLYVDNVFHEEDLEHLLLRDSFSVLPKGSYMLVTSRYVTVSDALRDSGVQWKKLSFDGLKDLDAEVFLENA